MSECVPNQEEEEEEEMQLPKANLKPPRLQRNLFEEISSLEMSDAN